MRAELFIVIGPKGLQAVEASTGIECLFPSCATAAEVRASIDRDKAKAVVMANARLQNESIVVDLGAAMRFHRAALLQTDLLMRAEAIKSPSPYNSKEDVARLQDTAQIGRTVMGSPTFGAASAHHNQPVTDRTVRAANYQRNRKGSARAKYDAFTAEYKWLFDAAAFSAVTINGLTRAAAAAAAIPIKHPVAIAVASVGGFIIGAAEAATATKIADLTTDAIIEQIDR